MADLAAALEAARQLSYATFTLAGRRDVTKEIAMIKLSGYRRAQQAASKRACSCDSLGFLADHWTSRWYATRAP